MVWDYLLEALNPLREIGATSHESELRCDYPNGGQVRLYGADNADALRGIYLDGVVLDEFADMDPTVWSRVISPALSDRNGWAVFIGTPKGRNAFYDIYQQALENQEWFSMMLRASESGLISLAELEAQRRLKTEDEYAQEYECSFDAAVAGTYYGKLIAIAETDGRITGVPYDRRSLVFTAWDIGIGDKTAIWWVQVCGREVHLLEYYEANGADAAHYVDQINKRPYAYGGHWLPHDADSREKLTGKSYAEFMQGLGLRNITVAPRLGVDEGINAVRMLLPRCWFDAEKCKQGVECLKMYRSEYDDKRKVFKHTPLHDWSSDGADAFRYLALMIDKKAFANSVRFDRDISYPNMGFA